MMNIVKLPTAYFPDPLRGFALSLGRVFIGVVDLDPTVLANRVTVTVLEEDGTLVPVAPSAQPFILNDGGLFVFNGSVVQLQVDSDFSMTVQDSTGSQKYFFPNSNSDVVFPATTTNRFPLKYTDGASGSGISGTSIETFFGITLAIGDQIITDSYNTSALLGSNGIFQYTGNTDLGKAGNCPDADGFFYDADGMQFELNSKDSNVLLYGATGNGATDDSAAIAAAIEGAKPGNNTFVMPSGDYSLATPLSINDDIVVEGQGLGNTTLLVESDIIGLTLTENNAELKNITLQLNDTSSTTNPAIKLDELSQGKLDRVSVLRKDISTKFDIGVLLDSAISTNLYDLICTNAIEYNLDINNKSGAPFPSNAVSVYGGYFAGAGTANVRVKDSNGASFHGGVIEAPGGSGIGLELDNADFCSFHGTWFENINNNVELSDSDWNSFFGGNFADSGVQVKTGCNFTNFFGIKISGTITIDSGATQTLLWGVNIASGFTDNGTQTNYTLCNVSGIGLKTSWNQVFTGVLEQKSGDVFRLWRSDFVGFELSKDEAGLNGWKLLGSGDNLVIFHVAAGVSTEVLKLISTGGVKIKDLPSSSPGVGSKQLWYDPADGDMVKFAP